MLLKQAEKLTNNSVVYDILHREYNVIGYRCFFDDGKLSEVNFRLQNHNISTIDVSYKYLYTDLNDLSDAELEFYRFIKNHKLSLPIEIMPHDQLNSILDCFLYGFNKGHEIGQRKL
jgi:hypothetical protein